MSYRIVVGIDFTEASTQALQTALNVLSATPHAELHLTHVVIDPDAGRHLERDESLMTEAYKKLRAFLLEESMNLPGTDRFERHVVYHVRLAKNPAHALEQVAFDVDADLVVVGTHARKGIEKWILGSVADALLQNGRVPLLVARPSNYEGMTRSEQIEPAKPGVDIHAQRHDFVYSTEHLVFGKRNSHVAGLL
jgi:nucleotide-binding universal stress UspA family protein